MLTMQLYGTLNSMNQNIHAVAKIQANRRRWKRKELHCCGHAIFGNGHVPTFFRLVDLFPGFAESQGQTAKRNSEPENKKATRRTECFYPTRQLLLILINAGGVIDQDDETKILTCFRKLTSTTSHRVTSLRSDPSHPFKCLIEVFFVR